MTRTQQHLTLKVCGITNAADAIAAIEAGADALGLIFVPESPRSVDVEDARAVVMGVRESLSNAGTSAQSSKARQPVKLVGVFRNETVSAMTEAVQALGLDRVQLHGDEPPETAQALPVPVIKALTIRPEMTLETLVAMLTRYAPSAEANIEALLLDTPKTTDATTHAWMRVADLLAEPAVQKLLQQTPHWLAGGLTAETVGDVVARFQPDGVDVASGVEQAPGRKDHARLQAFCAAARRAEKVYYTQNAGV